jgi:hypothetical protein
MFTSIVGELIGQLKGWFGRGFILAVWLPVFIFASAAAAVYLAGAGGVGTFAAVWAQWSAGDKALVSAEFVLAVSLVAFALEFAQVSITRLFEGYWSGILLLRSFGDWRRRRFERTLARLNERLEQLSELIPAEADAERPVTQLKAEMNRLEEQRLGFPPPDYEAHLMPTRLGNLYKSAELYPHARYNIDSVVVWSRFREVLPDAFVGRLQEVKTAVDFLLLFSLLSFVFSLLSVPYLLVRGAQPSLVLACAGGFPLAWLAYRAALSPAQAYAELLKVAFDLHRKALLKALGLRVPDTLTQEKALWREVSDFIFRGIEPAEDWEFDATPAKKDA